MCGIERSVSTLTRGFVIVAFLALGAGCKQGEGDRCQIDDDCEGTLVCSTSEHVCRSTTSSPSVDAMVDARSPADAGPDGRADAARVDASGPDAATAPDAAPDAEAADAAADAM